MVTSKDHQKMRANW